MTLLGENLEHVRDIAKLKLDVGPHFLHKRLDPILTAVFVDELTNSVRRLIPVMSPLHRSSE